jgi:CheY-like chemotaxis protein
VESAPGRGTTFTVDLPRVEEAAEPTATAAAPPGLLRGTETILLVEDEEGVRDLAREVLESCGYTVLEAPDPQAALGLGEAYEGPIDLLLTDVVMPQMGGRELADRLGRLSPGVRVLYMSGYTEDTVVQQGVLEGNAALLPKPFTARAFATPGAKPRVPLPDLSRAEYTTRENVPQRAPTAPPMPILLRVLILEDPPADAKLILEELTNRAGARASCQGSRRKSAIRAMWRKSTSRVTRGTP